MAKELTFKINIEGIEAQIKQLGVLEKALGTNVGGANAATQSAKQLSAEKAKLTQQIKAEKAATAEAAKAYGETKNAVAQLATEANNLNVNTEAGRKKFEEISAAITENAAKAGVLRGAINDLGVTVTDIEDGFTSSFTKINKGISTAGAAYEEFKQVLDAANITVLDEALAKVDTTIETVQGKIQTAGENFQTFKDILTTEGIDSLDDAVTRVDETLSAASFTVNNAQTAYDNLKAALDVTNINSLSEALLVADERIRLAKDGIDAAGVAYDSFKALLDINNITVLDEAFVGIDTSIDEAKIAIDSIQTAYTTFKGAISDIKKVKDLDSAMAAVDTSFDAAKVGIDSAQTAVNSFQKILNVAGVTKFDGAIQGVSTAFDTAREKVAVFEDIVGTAQEAISGAKTVMDGFKEATELAGKATQVTSALEKGYGVIKDVLTGKMKLSTLAQWAFNAAMNANPIGIVVTAVGLLIAGFVSLYNSSETVRGAIAGLGAAVKQIFTSIKDTALNVLGGVGDIIIGIFTLDLDRIKDGFSSATGAVSDAAKGVGDAFKQGYSDSIAGEVTEVTNEELDNAGEESKSKANENGEATGEEMKKGFNKGVDGLGEGTAEMINDELGEVNGEAFKDLANSATEACGEIECVTDKTNEATEAQEDLGDAVEDNADAIKKNTEALQKKLAQLEMDKAIQLAAIDEVAESEAEAEQMKLELSLKNAQLRLGALNALAEADGERTDEEIANIKRVKEEIEGLQQTIAELPAEQATAIEEGVNQVAEKTRDTVSGFASKFIDILGLNDESKEKILGGIDTVMGAFEGVKGFFQDIGDGFSFKKLLGLDEEGLSGIEKGIGVVQSGLGAIQGVLNADGPGLKIFDALGLGEEGREKVSQGIEFVSGALGQITSLFNKSGEEAEGGEGGGFTSLASSLGIDEAGLEKAQAGLEAMQSALSGLDSFLQARHQQQLEAVDEQTAKDIEAVQNSTLGEEEKAKRIEEIEANSAKRKEAIEKKANKQKKAISIAQAIVNGALAVTQAFAQLGPIGGAIATVAIAAMTAAQIAIIAKQKMKKGGRIPFSTGGTIQGPSHEQGGVPFMANGQLMEAEGGELVVHKGIWKRPDFVRAIADMNAMTGGVKFYASGGAIPRSAVPSPIVRPPANQVEPMTTEDLVRGLRGVISQEVGTLQVVNNVVDTGDQQTTVYNQQADGSF